ncbi:hypothetical protein [Nocardia gipuzkoensis]
MFDPRRVDDFTDGSDEIVEEALHDSEIKVVRAREVPIQDGFW